MQPYAHATNLWPRVQDTAERAEHIPDEETIVTHSTRPERNKPVFSTTVVNPRVSKPGGGTRWDIATQGVALAPHGTQRANGQWIPKR